MHSCVSASNSEFGACMGMSDQRLQSTFPIQITLSGRPLEHWRDPIMEEVHCRLAVYRNGFSFTIGKTVRHSGGPMLKPRVKPPIVAAAG